MQISLDKLSDYELELYKRTVSLQGTIEKKAEEIADLGIDIEYREVHRHYFQLANSTHDLKIEMESHKRLAFLNWIMQVEPSVFTGVGDLDREIVFGSYRRINELIQSDVIDKEFHWMLSYYSCWEWTILDIAGDKLIKLVDFVNSVDTDIIHLPSYSIRKSTMSNRGQVGINFQSLAHDV